MGLVKRHLMEMEDSGNFPPDELRGKYVCERHFSDPYINEMILRSGTNGCCSYCGRKGRVRDMYDLGRDMMWKITLYYSDIDDANLFLASDFYDDDDEEILGFKRVGPYVVPLENEVYNSVEEFVTALDLVTANDVLNDDIAIMFGAKQWISRDFYEENQTKHLSILWGKFCKEVTTHRRFTFLATPEYEGADNILDRLNNIIKEQKLCVLLPRGTELYRARKIKNPKKSYSFEDITSPPNESAFPNRMSPAGVSMFYASFDDQTPMHECVGEDAPVMIVGKFKTIKDLHVIDLTKIPNNSFWMKGWQENRFLHQFNEEITKPTDIADKNHLQYIPTQIITEYFRYMFQNDDYHIDGIIYGSAKTKERNVVLFCNQADSRNYVSRDVSIDIYNRTLVWKKIE